MNYAVLVGINAYPFPNVLHGCVNDALDISSELENHFQFQSSHITMITDEVATAENIKNTLSGVVNGLVAGDNFVFWYSGHGAQLINGNAGTDVICPVDFNFTPETSVTVDDFHEIFSKIPNGVIAAWGSDSCHSGDLEKDFYHLGAPKQFYGARPQAKPKSARKFKDISASLPNITLLAGCESSQTSADADINSRYNGAFTYFFLKQLNLPNGTTVQLQELMSEVSSALHRAGYPQSPQLSGRPSGTDKPFLSA